jgi:hypothetical protein
MWTWRFEGADGSTLDKPTSPSHPSQSDAENWIGEQWRELSADGVAQVTLFEDERQVYGPMALAES